MTTRHPTRLNRWWIPGEGIARVVISADIQRYLGPDAVVKPGDGINENEGIPGYWITAPRTLTTEMIQDLKLDTQRWEQEQRDAGRRGQQESAPSYEASATHRSRHYYGPSTSESPQAQSTQPERRGTTAYGEAQPHYTTTQGHYSNTANPSPYAAPSSYHHPQSVPRTASVNPYAPQYQQQQQQQQQPVRQDYQGFGAPQPLYNSPYSTQSGTAYSHTHNSYGTSHAPPPPNHQPQPQATRRVARQGYYIASDGNEYRIPPGGIPGQQ